MCTRREPTCVPQKAQEINGLRAEAFQWEMGIGNSFSVRCHLFNFWIFSVSVALL